jgi:hypothetical protein
MIDLKRLPIYWTSAQSRQPATPMLNGIILRVFSHPLVQKEIAFYVPAMCQLCAPIVNYVLKWKETRQMFISKKYFVFQSKFLFLKSTKYQMSPLPL